jgi:DNA-binding NarL/FixJ family response regulator
MDKKIRILIVDDHEVVRHGLMQILSQVEDMEIVGQCANGEEAVDQAETLFPDIILMDIKMPITNGLEATKRLRAADIPCSVIMLSMYEDYLNEALKAGARGYLLKDTKCEELTDAIRRVYYGEIVISSNINFEQRIYQLHMQATKMSEYIEKEVEIIIPLSSKVDTAKLFRLMHELEKIVDENHGRIIRVVGNCNKGTVVTVILEPAKLDNVINRLSNLANVNLLEEPQPVKSTVGSKVNRFNSPMESSKKICLTLM